MPAQIIDAKRESVLDHEQLQVLTGKTILITGAGGYLGTALCSSLYSVRCEIIALLHRARFLPVPPDSKASITYRQVDLAESWVWPNVLSDHSPDVIVNLAAHEHRRNSPHSPAIDLAVNAATVLELLEACRELELKPRIVLASSANLVGCPAANPVNEDTPDQPLTLYAINKLTAERYLRYYAETFNLSTVALRFANVYGPLAERRTERDREIESRVVLNNIMRRALAGGPLYLYRNKDCVRDFIYVDDAIRAIGAAATSANIQPGAKYIIGSGAGLTLHDIVNEIAHKAALLGGRDSEIHFDEEAALAPIEWRNFVADYSRFQSATGWKPRIKLSEGIEQTLLAWSAHSTRSALSAFSGGQTQ